MQAILTSCLIPSVPDAEVIDALEHVLWLDALADNTAPDLGNDPSAQVDLLELASKRDNAGPLATITLLLDALRQRHVDDSHTLAALTAVQFLHLPDLLDEAAGK
jgi:hypothetical protein